MKDEVEDLILLLEREIGIASSDILSGDLRGVTLQSILEFSSAIPIAELERRVFSLRAFDLSSLEQGVELLEQAVSAGALNSVVAAFGKQNFEVKDQLQRLREQVEILRSKEAELTQLDILARLEMSFSAIFENVLMCFSPFSGHLDPLKSFVLEKLATLSDDDIWALWRVLRSEFRKSEQSLHGFDPKSHILPDGFLSPLNAKDARSNLSTYLIVVKPHLIKEMRLSGEGSFALTVLGVARILTIRDPRSLERVSEQELGLLRNLSRLGVLWERLIKGKKEVFAAALKVSPLGLIAKGDWSREFEKQTFLLVGYLNGSVGRFGYWL